MRKDELLVTCLGVGKLPVAPGTWGSLVPAVVYMAAGILFGPKMAMGTMIFLCVAGCVISVLCSPSVIGRIGKKDPGQIVSDEVAGQSLALLMMQIAAPQLGFCLMAAIGFGLFRLFDILKPWPCKRLEQLPAGWGILVDDLAAGVYAALIWIIGRNLGVLESLAGLLGSEGGMSGGLAMFLGAIQGAAEFLPVSSSGHLVFFESFVEGISTETPEMLLFDLCLHLGTVLSISVVFRKSIVRFVRQLVLSFHGGLSPARLYEKNVSVRFAVLAVTATVITAMFFVLFKDPLESARSLKVVASMWLINAGLLWVAGRRHGKKGLRDFGLLMAVIIGLSQGFAILPGISRSGATICVALLLGMRPRWAIEFSFLISIPAIVGGALIVAIKNSQSLLNGHISIPYILIGMATAFVVGIISLKILIGASKKHKLKYFAVYCALLSLITLVYCL
jgi:undecaprenyl-diphosphatase